MFPALRRTPSEITYADTAKRELEALFDRANLLRDQAAALEDEQNSLRRAAERARAAVTRAHLQATDREDLLALANATESVLAGISAHVDANAGLDESQIASGEQVGALLDSLEERVQTVQDRALGLGVALGMPAGPGSMDTAKSLSAYLHTLYNATLPDALGPVDQRFQSLVLGCSRAAQKQARRRLQGLVQTLDALSEGAGPSPRVTAAVRVPSFPRGAGTRVSSFTPLAPPPVPAHTNSRFQGQGQGQASREDVHGSDSEGIEDSLLQQHAEVGACPVATESAQQPSCDTLPLPPSNHGHVPPSIPSPLPSPAAAAKGTEASEAPSPADDTSQQPAAAHGPGSGSCSSSEGHSDSAFAIGEQQPEPEPEQAGAEDKKRAAAGETSRIAESGSLDGLAAGEPHGQGGQAQGRAEPLSVSLLARGGLPVEESATTAVAAYPELPAENRREIVRLREQPPKQKMQAKQPHATSSSPKPAAAHIPTLNPAPAPAPMPVHRTAPSVRPSTRTGTAEQAPGAEPSAYPAGWVEPPLVDIHSGRPLPAWVTSLAQRLDRVTGVTGLPVAHPRVQAILAQYRDSLLHQGVHPALVRSVLQWLVARQQALHDFRLEEAQDAEAALDEYTEEEEGDEETADPERGGDSTDVRYAHGGSNSTGSDWDGVMGEEGEEGGEELYGAGPRATGRVVYAVRGRDPYTGQPVLVPMRLEHGPACSAQRRFVRGIPSSGLPSPPAPTVLPPQAKRARRQGSPYSTHMPHPGNAYGHMAEPSVGRMQWPFGIMGGVAPEAPPKPARLPAVWTRGHGLDPFASWWA